LQCSETGIRESSPISATSQSSSTGTEPELNTADLESLSSSEEELKEPSFKTEKKAAMLSGNLIFLIAHLS